MKVFIKAFLEDFGLPIILLIIAIGLGYASYCSAVAADKSGTVVSFYFVGLSILFAVLVVICLIAAFVIISNL
jgi:hypothetical protein